MNSMNITNSTNNTGISNMSNGIDYSLPYRGRYLVGTLFGWCSAIICITSRVPQVVMNFKRKIVTNLSPYFFACTILGNATYFLSLIIRNQTAEFMWRQAPWLFECLGPLTCDIITSIQMCIYGFTTRDYYNKEEDNENIEDVDNIDDIDNNTIEEIEDIDSNIIIKELYF